MSGDMIKIYGGNPLRQFVSFFCGAHIGPDQAGIEGVALFVHTQTGHHGATERNGSHIGGVDVGKKGLRGLADGFPPVVGVLVDPCTVMNVKIVRIDCTLYQFSLAGEERGLVAGSTQIMCQQISGHSIILPLFSNLESNDQNLMTIFSAGSRLAMTWKALSVSPNGKT